MDGIEFGGFLVNVIMMMIAIASSLVSYLVYKENSSPDIIVYLDQDEHARTILNLVIKNIGKSPAKDVSFTTDKIIPQNAFNGQKCEDMYKGPLITGIPFLAPGTSRVLMYGGFSGLKDYFNDEKIKVEIFFFKANSKSFFSRKIKNVTYLDVYSFAGVSASDNSTGRGILTELQGIKKAISSKG